MFTTTEEFSFHLDLDNCLVQSERKAVEKGAWETMLRYQRDVLRKNLPIGKVLSHRDGTLVAKDGFCQLMAGTTMKMALMLAARQCALTVPESTVDEYDVEEQLLVTDAFSVELSPMPGAANLLTSLRKYGKISIVSSSVLYRMWVSLQSAGLLHLVDQLVTAQGDGYWRGESGNEKLRWVPPEEWRGRCHSSAYHAGESKPKPDPYAYNLSYHLLHLGDVVRPKTITIEDSAGGMKAATAAQMTFRVGLVGPEIPAEMKARHSEALMEAGAHVVVYSLGQASTKIEEWIKQQRKMALVG